MRRTVCRLERILERPREEVELLGRECELKERGLADEEARMNAD